MKKYSKFFKSLNRNINKVYSYGFSYGKVDGVYIKEIINHISENATWLFTEHEANNHEALRIKKVKLRRYGFTGSFGIFEGKYTRHIWSFKIKLPPFPTENK